MPNTRIVAEVFVGMKPLSERDENRPAASSDSLNISNGRNEATL